MEDDYWKPDSVQLVHGDHIHRLAQFDVVEVKSGINPSHAKTEFQLKYLLDLFDLLDHHYLQAVMYLGIKVPCMKYMHTLQ